MTLADAVSEYVGLVTSVDELLPSPDDARHFHVVAAPAAVAHLPGQPGSGYGSDRTRVGLAALGEAVERYSAAQVPVESFVEASARELGPAAVDPASFALFAPEQRVSGFLFASFTAETRVTWVRGVRLADGAEAWLPAQLVYLVSPRDEPRIGYATSNGLAAGPDEASALEAALLELVERDAFMLAWNARLSLPLLDWRSDGALTAYHDRYLAPSGATLSAVDLSDVHGIPVVLAVVRGNPGALVVGACASCDVRTAWLGAVTEAYAVRKAARETVLAEPVNPFVPPFAGIRDFQDHVRVYAYAENADRAAFLDASPVSRQPHEVPRVPGGDALARVDALVARLASHGIDTYAVDVTAPDVRELGVHVMRVVAPRLLPLDVRHDARFLGGKRLYTEPERLGYASRRLTFADLNPDPHPFP